MTAARQLKLGFILHGNGVGWGDWRHPEANAAGSTDFAHYNSPADRPYAGGSRAEIPGIHFAGVDRKRALSMLGRPFNDHDFSTYPLDEPFPDVAHAGLNSQQSSVLKIIRTAQAEGLTLRQVALRFATPRNVFTGTPEQVADALQAAAISIQQVGLLAQDPVV